VRELPNEWAIEHGGHCDEHEANDEPGPRSGFVVLLSCIHDRPSIAQPLAMAAPGIAHPGAAKIGRIRALTPRVRRAVPSWRLLAGETRATCRQMARAAHFVHPPIRGLRCSIRPCASSESRFLIDVGTPREWSDAAADRATRSIGALESLDLHTSSTSVRAGPRPGHPRQPVAWLCSILTNRATR
jgi:hypothetical protein